MLTSQRNQIQEVGDAFAWMLVPITYSYIANVC